MDNKEFCKRIYAAAGNDMELIVNAFADDVVWEHPQAETIPWGGNRYGKEQTLAFFKTLDEHLELIHVTPERLVDLSASEVIAFGHEKFRVKRNQRIYEVEWAHLWRIENGQAVFFKEYTDSAALVDAWLDR
jgi:ketosteroid isomerase-like protein